MPIHGLGLQGHWTVNEPSEKQLDSTIKQFADIGLKVQITEVDISIYPKEHKARATKPEDADTAFTPEKENKQIEVYKMCFKTFRKYRKAVTGVTFFFAVLQIRTIPMVEGVEGRPENYFMNKWNK